MTTSVQPTDTSATAANPSWLQRIDSWSERIGDAVNPILVKETRQALKSRQFVVTFSVLLVAALGWTVAGSISMMPQIYTTPSAPRMLIGYYIALAIPLLLVVPLAAYRSLEGEIDDGTLELLSITVLSPWQIVLGKLASASLQMVLYFVALLPCVAYAYTLRGVDLPTTILMILILVVAALLLTVIALFFAPLAKNRTGRILTLLAAIAILMGSQWGIGYFVISLIDQGNPLPADLTIFFTVAAVAVAACLGHLLLTATAAQLTPESENRSTPLRISMLLLTTVVIMLAAFGIQHPDDDIGVPSFMLASFGLAAIWGLAAPMMVSESSVMTPRIQRELPSNFLSRSLLTWLTPGPTTGMVFATMIAVMLAGLFLVAFETLIVIRGNRGGIASARIMMHQFAFLFVGYFVAFLACVRGIVAVVRIKNNPRADIGFAAMIVVMLLAVLVPYAIGLMANDYRSFDYSNWQITNWIWTFGQAGQRGLSGGQEYIVASIGAAMFALCLMMSPGIVLPRKTATPKRVLEVEGKT